MTRDKLLYLLRLIASGEASPEDGADRLKHIVFENLEFATIDHHRSIRRGLPEVIFGEGKTPDQILTISNRMKDIGSPVLITRLSADKWHTIREKASFLKYYEVPRCAAFRASAPDYPAKIVICSAGTSDLPVSEEAAVTLETFGHPVTRIPDVGVAGLHRTLAHLEDLKSADVIIAVAGMEGALPSVIAGIVDCPVIGVPTSIGYGTSFGGITALLAMLNSCSGGVTVVNIDNGFGAAYAAALMVRRLKPYQVADSGTP